MRPRARRDRGALDRVDRYQHAQQTVADLWQDLTEDICREVGRREVGCVSHDYDRGLVLEVVPFPGSEATSSLLVNHLTNGQKAKRPTVEFYKGAFGELLVQQPPSHRKRWSDHQWASYHDFMDESRKEYEAVRRGRAWERPIIIKPHTTDVLGRKIHARPSMSTAQRAKISRSLRKTWKQQKAWEQRQEEFAQADAEAEKHKRAQDARDAESERLLLLRRGGLARGASDAARLEVKREQWQRSQDHLFLAATMQQCATALLRRYHTADVRCLNPPRWEDSVQGPLGEPLWIIETLPLMFELVCPQCGVWKGWGTRGTVEPFNHTPGCKARQRP